MVVCLCNRISDRDLHPHTACGGCSVGMVYQALGVRPQCGKCVPFVRQMLKQGAEAAAVQQSAAAG